MTLRKQLSAVTLVAACAAIATVCGGTVAAQDMRKHALSLVGEPKFGPDFKHFDWVNPDAPKGGVVRQWAMGSFDSLNPYTIKGDAAVGIGLIYDTLVTSSSDEPATEYAHIAEWISYPADHSSVTFGLRQEARFHDGRPITPEDVIFSLNALKKSHPQYAYYYKNVIAAEKTGERQVTFRFDTNKNKELPHIMGQIPVLPKHFWEGKTKDGEPRDLSKTTMEVPLGSGPYRIKSFEPGRSIVYERVADWWAKDLPTGKGMWNFGEIRFDYFRDKTPAFEAFKVGTIDYWQESSAKDWATRYDFPALRKELVKRESIAVKRPTGMQAFAFNTRRPKFKDARVRRAFNLAYDFEWANKNIFFDQYTRISSFFGGTELASSGLPQGQELAILQEVKADVPPEVFTTEYANPLNKASGDSRKHLAEAQKLLSAAGWKIREEKIDDPSCGFFCRIMTSVGLRSAKTRSVLRSEKGESLEVEFLLVEPSFERVVSPYLQNLKLLGIEARIRTVDSAQYARRRENFDYDIIVASFGQSFSPGNEQRNYWGSAAADRPGSRNFVGIKNAGVDKLIDRIIYAKDRAELVAATRGLDRVLLWSHYVVPQWHLPAVRLAYWNKFGRPQKLPMMSPEFLQTWWVDPAAEKRLAEARSK